MDLPLLEHPNNAEQAILIKAGAISKTISFSFCRECFPYISKYIDEDERCFVMCAVICEL